MSVKSDWRSSKNFTLSDAHTILVLCNKTNLSTYKASKSSSVYKHNLFQIKLK